MGQAGSHAEDAVALMKKTKRQDGIADELCDLAQIESAQGNHPVSLEMLEEALGIYSQLGIQKKIDKTQKEIDKIHEERFWLARTDMLVPFDHSFLNLHAISIRPRVCSDQ